jgi:glycosyltransferase involved in cell wall biosynthesis
VRILLVTPFYEPAWAYGGIARATSGLARALAARGHQVLVVTARLAAEDPAEQEAGGVRVLRFDSPGFLTRRLFPWPRGLARRLRAECPHLDVAHIASHRQGFALVAWRALRAARIPYIVQPHGTYPHHAARRMAKQLFDLLAGDGLIRGARSLLAVSQAEAADLPPGTPVIPNGVAPVGSAPATGELPTTLGQTLLFVGSDAPQKRAHLLGNVLQALPRVRLSLLGRFGRAFRERFAAFGDRVEFPGVLAGDSLASAYATADLLVHPAVGEAFGLAPFEASLFGTGSVAVGGHGCGEWLARAGGCVVPADAPDALVEAVRLRIDNPALAKREAEAVAGFARRHLTWSEVAERVDQLYRSVLSANYPGPQMG